MSLFGHGRIGVHGTRGSVTLNVRIARTPLARERGLQDVRRLGAREGMLFVFPTEKRWTMWMHNTHIALDMLFADQHGRSYVLAFDTGQPEPDVSECPQPEPPTDVCPNLEGNQSTVPDGYEVVNGLCVPIVIPPPPPAGLCFYKISGGNEAAKKAKCEATLGGNPPAFGVWLNFDDSSHNVLDNHCQYSLPGINDDKFQLTPGQSDPSCLNKNDD